MPIPFIAYRAPGTKNSFNALIAAIDQSGRTDDVAVTVVANWKELTPALNEAVHKAADVPGAVTSAPISRPVVAFSYGSETGRTVHLDRLERLLSRVRETVGPKRGIYFGSFPSEARPEHVTPETLALVRRYANNDNLVIGAQSGSDRMLERLHRDHTVADVVHAVERIRANRLEAYVDFIFGLPGETDADLNTTFQLIDRLARLGAKTHAHAFLPLPGTPLGDAEAHPLSPAVVESLHQLIPKGLAFGQWSRQAADARRIAGQRRAFNAR